MYKKQLRFQKIICLMAIIVAAIWFVYSLGFITTIYELVGTQTEKQVPGAHIYKDMQPFNNAFNTYALYSILISVLLLVTNTHTRRKYYITNYIATGLNVISGIILPFYAYTNLSKFANQFKNTIDFVALKKRCERRKVPYTESTFLLDLNVVIGILSILVVIGLVVNLIWKISLMRGEKKLINDGKEVA